MNEIEIEQTADLINPESFRSNEDAADKILDLADIVISRDPVSDEDVVQAMKNIKVLGDSISTELFDANPILANRTLEIFMNGLNHTEDCVRGQTVETIRRIIVNSCTGECTKLNEEIIRRLLQGIYPSSPSTESLVRSILNGDTEEISQNF